MADRGVVGVAERQWAGNEQQVEQLEQQRRRAELRRTLRALGMAEWAVGIYSDANLDLMLREHFVNLASFRTGSQVSGLMQQAGLPVILAAILATVLDCATAEQLAALQGVVAAGHGGRSSAAGPSAGPEFAAQATHAQQHTDAAGHVRDQEPPRGGSSASKGWWSAWLPTVPPLTWSTQPAPPPQSSQPLLPGSTLSQPNDAAAATAAVTVATATPSHTQTPAAAAARGHAADLRDAARSVSAAASLTPPAPQQLPACRRRHVHRPALGQQE